MATLRERLAQDLEIRGRSPRTQEAYVACVRNFVEHFGLPPGKLGVEQIREYQLFLIHERGISFSYFNQIVCALRFFYNVTLERGWDIDRLPYQKREQRLPEILSQEEVAAMLAVTDRLRDRAIMMALYGAGLRLGEVKNLCITDIDSQRMVMRVLRGKGRKDRYVRLPDALLRELRTYWKADRPHGPLLFPGKIPGAPLSDGVIQKMVKDAARKAGITKRITPHSLRHAYGTHHLEQGTNLREIQLLLGHRSLNTTAIYTHVARTTVAAAASPLDALPVQKRQVRKRK